jgi:hypothetical protein
MVLLGDWKNTVRLNDNISTPYVLYQFLLLVSTILGPATVLLMMAGAFTVVFKTTIIEKIQKMFLEHALMHLLQHNNLFCNLAVIVEY